MAWDIYGNPLRAGYCEVHPDIAMPYPCSVCQHQRAEQERIEHESAMRAMTKVKNREQVLAAIKSLPENERARQFLRLLFENGPCCEGIEELAVECGIIEQIEVLERCSEHCACADHGFYEGMRCNKMRV